VVIVYLKTHYVIQIEIDIEYEIFELF